MAARESRPLFVAEPDGTYTPATDSLVIAGARGAIRRSMARGPKLSTPDAARRYLVPLLGHLDYEVFCVLHLDQRHRLLHFEELFRGTIDAAAVYPREVLRSVLVRNTAAVIVAHNHPSRDPSPSTADELLTSRLKEALSMIDCRLLDHCIVGGDEMVSVASAGLM